MNDRIAVPVPSEYVLAAGVGSTVTYVRPQQHRPASAPWRVGDLRMLLEHLPDGELLTVSTGDGQHAPVARVEMTPHVTLYAEGVAS